MACIDFRIFNRDFSVSLYSFTRPSGECTVDFTRLWKFIYLPLLEVLIKHRWPEARYTRRLERPLLLKCWWCSRSDKTCYLLPEIRGWAARPPLGSQDNLIKEHCGTGEGYSRLLTVAALCPGLSCCCCCCCCVLDTQGPLALVDDPSGLTPLKRGDQGW